MLKYGLSSSALTSQQNSQKKDKVGGFDSASSSAAAKLAKQNSVYSIPSTLDPANPLSLTSVARIKKLPTQERSSMGNKPQHTQHVSNFTQQSASQSQVVVASSAASKPIKSFKHYSTVSQNSQSQVSVPENTSQQMQLHGTHNSSANFAMKYSSNALAKSQGNQSQVTIGSNRRNQTSPKTHSSMVQRSSRCGNQSPRNGLRGSARHYTTESVGSGAAGKDEQSISHSQAIIEKSRYQRMNSGGRVVPDIVEQVHIDLECSQENQLQSSSLDVPFEETMRDEVVSQLRQSLETERKKHREMKQIFDETMQNIEAQNRHVPEEAIEIQASKAVDEILTHGAVTKSALEEELEKQKQVIAEMKQRESDNQNQVQMLEKKLLHAQMREKESLAQEQIRQLQQETEERKLKFEIEKYKEQVKDLRNNEEQLKADHTQTVLELTDQTEEVRAKQAAEDEERFMRQINEIKQTHARERDTLVQQKFAATQELQMIKMDHSELIRNTNFEDQRELIETITAQQAQIQHLTVLMNEQQSNFELKESQLTREKKNAEQQIEQLESRLETSQNEKTAMQTELNGKCKDLEGKLEEATKDKEKAYKNQMEKIQENLESLKEQIQSTNQSLMDQTMHIPQAESSSLALGLGPVGRLNSPDFRNPLHQRGEPISISSPRVPRIHARLNNDNLQRMQSPLAAVTSRHHQREKSGDQRAFMTGSEMQELTQMMSSGTAEQTMNLGAMTAGQALFNQTNGQVGGAQNNTNSFMLDPIFNDYYVEYVMLHKLQALTNNFTCQNCWQVLNFTRFFDEDHLCLHQVNVPGGGPSIGNGAPNGAPHHVKHSQIGLDQIEESKAMTMFGHNIDDSTVRLNNLAVVNSPQNSAQNTQQNNQDQQQKRHSFNSRRYQRSSSAYDKRSSHPNLPNLMKATAQAATGGVIVKEITLTATNDSKQTGRGSSQDPESRNMATGSFQQSNTNGGGTLETSIDTQLDNSIQRIVVQQAPAMSTRQQVNQMQLHAYVQKLKEYRVSIVNLEEELRRCKQENESLIFDLRDSKTKVAVLEENKAQLQMELARERKRQVKQTLGQAKVNAEQKIADQRSPRSPALNLTVNTQSYGGVFGMGGKSNFSVKVQPALNSTQKQQVTGITSNGKTIAISTAAQQVTESDQKQLNLTPRNKCNSSDEKPRERERQQNKTYKKALFRSPQSRMVPLSQKFSAFPTSEQKALGYGPGGMAGASTIHGGYTRNMDLSLQSCSIQNGLASHRSLNNLTQQLNSSVQNLRGGRHTTRMNHNNNEEVEGQQQYYHQINNAVAGKLQQQRSMKDEVRIGIVRRSSSSQLAAPLGSAQQMRERDQEELRGNHSRGNESCDISPDHDGSGNRRLANGQLASGNYIEEVNEGEMSSMNPLATGAGGVTERGADTGRCSLFDEQESSHKHRSSKKRSAKRPQKDAAAASPDNALARSQRMVKLNNPYDEVSITRQQQRMSNSPEGHHETNEKRKALFPNGFSSKLPQKKKTMPPSKQVVLQTQTHSIATPPPVMIKNAVPLSKLAKMNSMGVRDRQALDSARFDNQILHNQAESDDQSLIQTGNFSQFMQANNMTAGKLVEGGDRTAIQGHGGQPNQTDKDEPLSVEEL